MTEKEFRKLVTDLELSRSVKDDVSSKIENIEESLKSELKHVELLKLIKIGSIAKSTMLSTENTVDILAVFKYDSNKTFKLINQLVINSVTNVVSYLYDSILKVSDVEINNVLNYISFNIDNLTYNIYIRYEKTYDDTEFIDYSSFEKHVLFTELANRDYTYFRNCVAIIKHFRNEQKINISGHIIETLLYYSLNEYFKDNRYETYLNAFLRGIDDFLKQKQIEVSKDILEKLNVEITTNNIHKGYVVVDLSNPAVNLVAGISEIKLGEYRKLKKSISRLVDTDSVDLSKEQVVLNINPKEINNKYVWSYEIENSKYHTDGGSYEKTEENFITASLKALSKGLKTIVDNNLNKRQIKLVSKYSDLLTRNELYSAENVSRRKTIIAFMEVNNITIAKN